MANQGYSVCHIPPVTITSQPDVVDLPAVPPAQPTLASLTASVNAMRQVILILTGQQGTQGRPGAPGRDGKGKSDPPTRWAETTRVVETVRIFSPDDKSVYVDVERINRLIMSDKATKELWSWDRERR